MNLQAALDGLLAVSALWLARQAGPKAPALRLGCVLLGIAAVLGTLRFSGLLPLPAWHQFFSMLGAGVGLPLLAIAMTQPRSAIASQRRFAWVFGVTAAVTCTLLVMVVQWKLWTSVCALASAIGMLIWGIRHQQGAVTATGLLMLITLGAFAAKLQAGPLQPGDLLHLGLTLVLWLLIHWQKHPAPDQPNSLHSPGSR
jgi:hypothetical protein